MEKTIALIYMSNGDEFFVLDPPKKDIKDWIGNSVYNPDDVEYVEVYKLGETVKYWSNPDCSSED
jgi:hypothetical protein